jgi:hypothetical protein
MRFELRACSAPTTVSPASPNSVRSPPAAPRRIKDDESVRAPLQMLSNLLNLWERDRIGDLLDATLVESLV